MAEQAVDLFGGGGRLFPGVAGRRVAAGHEQLVGHDEHRLRQIEGGLDGRAGDRHHGAGQCQLLVGETSHLGTEDQGGGSVRRSLCQPAGKLAGREEGDAQAAVARRGGAHHPAERSQGLGEAGDADDAVENLPGSHREGPGRVAELRRRLHQEEAGEPHVGHRPGRRSDVALHPRPDEDDCGSYRLNH